MKDRVSPLFMPYESLCSSQYSMPGMRSNRAKTCSCVSAARVDTISARVKSPARLSGTAKFPGSAAKTNAEIRTGGCVQPLLQTHQQTCVKAVLVGRVAAVLPSAPCAGVILRGVGFGAGFGQDGPVRWRTAIRTANVC